MEVRVVRSAREGEKTIETRVSRDCRSALRIIRLVVPPHIRIPIIIALSNGFKISITTPSHYSEHGTILVNQ